ncbi:hypothetical protein ACS0TY_017320 [Phlomoides rotata]
MEFLSRPASTDGPLVAFGGSDGMIRVLSMLTWKLARRYTGGHKGSISCLMTFMASSGEVVLIETFKIFFVCENVCGIEKVIKIPRVM